MTIEEHMRELRLILATLTGAVNIQREAISILLSPTPLPALTGIALSNAAQKLKDQGLDKAWDEEHLAAYQAGIEKTLSLLSPAILRAEMKGGPPLPPGLMP